uniref:Uncharacterized protein n=1 Tax=Oreochromis niloticus TaxID=8128 RepID=A0A669DP66_ORENI
MKEKVKGEVSPNPRQFTYLMPELLPELQHIGLGPRTFKKRQSPQNTGCSIWMDTPADIKCKARVFRNNRFTLCNWFVFTHRNGLRESKRVKQRKTVCRVSQKVSKYNASALKSHRTLDFEHLLYNRLYELYLNRSLLVTETGL